VRTRERTTARTILWVEEDVEALEVAPLSCMESGSACSRHSKKQLLWHCRYTLRIRGRVVDWGC
jgi:hypothetical protein